MFKRWSVILSLVLAVGLTTCFGGVARADYPTLPTTEQETLDWLSEHWGSSYNEGEGGWGWHYWWIMSLLINAHGYAYGIGSEFDDQRFVLAVENAGIYYTTSLPYTHWQTLDNQLEAYLYDFLSPTWRASHTDWWENVIEDIENEYYDLGADTESVGPVEGYLSNYGFANSVDPESNRKDMTAIHCLYCHYLEWYCRWAYVWMDEQHDAGVAGEWPAGDMNELFDQWELLEELQQYIIDHGDEIYDPGGEGEYYDLTIAELYASNNYIAGVEDFIFELREDNDELLWTIDGAIEANGLYEDWGWYHQYRLATAPDSGGYGAPDARHFQLPQSGTSPPWNVIGEGITSFSQWMSYDGDMPAPPP